MSVIAFQLLGIHQLSIQFLEVVYACNLDFTVANVSSISVAAIAKRLIELDRDLS